MPWKINFSMIFLHQIRQLRPAMLKSKFRAKFHDRRILEGLFKVVFWNKVILQTLLI